MIAQHTTRAVRLHEHNQMADGLPHGVPTSKKKCQRVDRVCACSGGAEVSVHGLSAKSEKRADQCGELEAVAPTVWFV